MPTPPSEAPGNVIERTLGGVELLQGEVVAQPNKKSAEPTSRHAVIASS
jgi:hypothetical protein